MIHRTLTAALCGLFLFGTLYAQGRDPGPTGLPNNNYVYALHREPGDEAIVITCAQVIDNNTGNVYRVPGALGHLSTYYVYKSGGHTHDSNGAFPLRPPATILSNNPQYTGSDGCINWTVQLPAYAGFYTFEVIFDPIVFYGDRVTPLKAGINFWSRVYGLDGRLMTPYPNNPTINVDQSFNPDDTHTNNSRYLDDATGVAVLDASQQYKTDSSTKLGVIDRLNIYRGSLPEGGLSDNFANLVAYDTAYDGKWFVEQWEEHARGVEVDVINPSWATGSPASAVYLAFIDMQAKGCTPGIHAPGGIVEMSDPYDYWMHQSYIHFACKPAPLPRMHGTRH